MNVFFPKNIIKISFISIFSVEETVRTNFATIIYLGQCLSRGVNLEACSNGKMAIVLHPEISVTNWVSQVML